MRERFGNVQSVIVSTVTHPLSAPDAFSSRRPAHVDLAASTMTIVPGPAAVFPPNPIPALAPISSDDVDMLFDLELSDPTSVFYSPTGRLAPASILEPPAFLLDSVEENPSTSSISSRSNSLWASSASTSSDWWVLPSFCSLLSLLTNSSFILKVQPPRLCDSARRPRRTSSRDRALGVDVGC